jgi:hypothetical protein
MDWKLHPPGAHFQTPGLLGLSPPGRPLSLREHTDALSQLLTPGPIGHNPWNEKVAREAYIRALLAKQTAARGEKKPIWGLPDEELKPVPNAKRMHKRSAKPTQGWWIALALGLAVALQAGIARADVVVRNQSEGDDDFVARVLGPSVEIAQKVVRSTELAGRKLTLIGFASPKDASAEDNSLVGHLFIETSPGRYEHVKFPSCQEEGGAPELLAVFFARTVKGGGRDLAVLCRWEARHAVAQGMSYSAQFYRLKERGSEIVVESVTDLNKRFETDNLVHENEHGKWVKGPKAKFKTVAEVKKLLTKMGFEQ